MENYKVENWLDGHFVSFHNKQCVSGFVERSLFYDVAAEVKT